MPADARRAGQRQQGHLGRTSPIANHHLEWASVEAANCVVTAYVNMLLICRQLERIARHTVNVAGLAAAGCP